VRFDPARKVLLEQRQFRQQQLDAGQLPDFLPETREIREADWKIGSIPDQLLDRRVEITGPVDRKMIINALNSGARVFMADFEDSSTPSWENMMAGQVNLGDAVRGTISFENPAGKRYQLEPDPAILFVRPRGLHLEEKHLQLNGQPVSGSLVDFGLFLYHNATRLVEQGSGPYFNLPRLEHHNEAGWWEQVLIFSEEQLGLEAGTIKVTVLIETLWAGFQMDEILYELGPHIVALNCGRWDYIFSYIKALKAYPDKVLPDRSQVTMEHGFLRAYSQLLIKTCHRRGALAMGGMAAQIPVKHDPAANEEALRRVRADKQREAGDGHDGTWVAHPALIPLAMEIFDQLMPAANQLDRKPSDIVISQEDLLRVPAGQITEAGLRGNVTVAIRYLAAWLAGNGCVPIDYLMEDAATAEIARSQIWQWTRHPAGRLPDGRNIDLALFDLILDQQLSEIRAGDQQILGDELQKAADLLSQLVHDDDFIDFLTLPAYQLLP
jgi:malate synthase